jgi:anthranilate/para-aminobenzoate synthase component I
MIVDLERNDLGRVCRIGSIGVDPLMSVEGYTGLQHLVSVVRGRLRPDLGPVDALAALFPGRLHQRRAQNSGPRDHPRT